MNTKLQGYAEFLADMQHIKDLNTRIDLLQKYENRLFLVSCCKETIKFIIVQLICVAYFVLRIYLSEKLSLWLFLCILFFALPFELWTAYQLVLLFVVRKSQSSLIKRLVKGNNVMRFVELRQEITRSIDSFVQMEYDIKPEKHFRRNKDI